MRKPWLALFWLMACMRMEAQEHVGEHLFHLTDKVGPRLVGSPALRQSREWLQERLREYGLPKVWKEANGPIEIGPSVSWNPRGWMWAHLHVQQLTPWTTTLTGVPVLYSNSTPGLQRGAAAIVELPKPEMEAVEKFIAEQQGKLKSKFLLTRPNEVVAPMEERILNYRYKPAELQAFGVEPPRVTRSTTPPTDSAKQSKGPTYEQMLAAWSQLNRFLEQEGVLGLIGAARGEGGALGVRPSQAPPIVKPTPPPMFDLAAEHYNRILRLIRHGVPVDLAVDLRTELYEEGTENLMAEISGLQQEADPVLVGAHLDSWHGGTGATDNAANVAVLLEAARALAQFPTKPKRSIRFAFWDGEEFGMIGSRAYVARKNPLHVYFNLDYGAGRIRGLYLQGRTAATQTVQAWLDQAPGEKLIASPWTSLGSDQASFHRAGLPGFSFIQDPMSYELRTHHTTMDVPEFVSEEALQHNVRVLVKVLWAAANSDERVPR